MLRLVICSLIGVMPLGGSVLPALAQQVDQDTARFSVSQSEEGVDVSDHGRLVLHFQAKPKSRNGTHRRANYVHPLCDSEGNVLTEDFPADHPHHRGVFWAWHQIDLHGEPAGDGWLTRDFEWRVHNLKAKTTDLGTVQIRADTDWRSPKIADPQGRPLTLIREATAIEIHPAKDDRRSIDFDIRLLAARPGVAIGGSDDAKGYGGFSVRLKQPPDLTLLTSKGSVKAEAMKMDCGSWVDFVGTMDGESKPSGLAILVHPSTTGFPQKWILRSNIKSMQNPVFPGRELTPVSETQPIVLRYRLVVHRHPLEERALDLIYEEYAKSN